MQFKLACGNVRIGYRQIKQTKKCGNCGFQILESVKERNVKGWCETFEGSSPYEGEGELYIRCIIFSG